MKINPQETAEILVEALPYVQKYFNKVIVVKYGGNAMTSEELKLCVMKDIVLLSKVGVKVVLVHGGGPEITDALTKMNIPTKFIDGLRVTDLETAKVVQMVLAGKVNKDLVNLIEKTDGKALGLCGIDGHMIEAKPISEKLGYAGAITSVNTELINSALESGFIPVIATVGCDKTGNVYNVNADTAASEIAAALSAACLISMTDVKGILRDKEDENSLISTINVSDAPQLIRQGVIAGGMIPKIQGCVAAVRKGVKKAFVIDGRVPHAILIEMLSDEGLGTMLI